MAAKKRITELEAENAALKKKLEEYESFIDDTIDNIHDKEEKNKKEAIESKQDNEIDWKLIRLKYQQEDDEYMMKLINDEKMSITDDYDEYGDNLWSLSCQYGRINIIKMCVNLGVDISNIKNKNGYDASHIARSYNQDEILEYLLLEKIGAGKANDIVKSCDFMWNEDGVLSAFLNQLNQLNESQFNINLKQQIVEIVISMIKNRDPISSFLINLSMSLDPNNTWQCIKNIMDNIINDTTDSIGWYYLNNYLVKNNTFLFRKYQLYSNKDGDDDEKTENKKRKINELNEKELIYFLKNICIHKYNDDINNDNKNITDSECKMIINTINSEHIDGTKFCENYNDMMKLYSFLQSSGLDFDAIFPFATFLDNNFICNDKINSVLYDIPFIIEDEYGFDKICEKSIVESSNHAMNDIKHIFENEEKQNKNNWLFIKEYGKDFISLYGKNKRLRQDLLKNGVKSKYSKDEMIKNMRKTTAFNGLKFYDTEIYLNRLLLRCAILNHHFQIDVESIFMDQPNVTFRAGPLKKKERCKIKTETDYFNQEWPQSACLLDIIRCTVICNDISTMIENIKLFQNVIKNKTKCIKHILRIKNGFIEYDHLCPEYVDIKYNVSINIDGRECIAEIQFLLNEMSKFKVKAHKFYGVIRQKEYFDNFKLVSALKNNLDKKLMIYAQKGNDKGIKDILIKERIKNLKDLQKINRLNDSLWSIYHYGHVQCLKSFISLFKNDEQSISEFLRIRVSDFGGTGLMLSSFHGKLEMAKYILSLLKDKNIESFIFEQNNLGRTAFMCCSFQGQLKNAKLILSKLNKNNIIRIIHKKNQQNETCLIEAAKNGHINMMELILSNLNDNNDKIEMMKEKDKSNRNVFDTACINKHIKTAKFILSQLQSLNAKNEAIKMIKDAEKLKLTHVLSLNLKTWMKEFS